MVPQQVVLPRIGPLADTHAHLDMLDDPAAALAAAALAGLELVLSVVDITEQPERTLRGLDGWREDAARILRDAGRKDLSVPEVRIVAGVHPHDASKHDADVAARLDELLAADRRIVAVGEAGLDFHYDHSPRDAQRAMFADHLVAARRASRPIVVHLREAHEEGLRILSEVGVPPAGCVIHCFTEGPELALRFLELGCHVSFAGPVTFAKADRVREAAAVVPIEKLLAETDCPFLAPVPFRGRPNEPANVALTTARLAEVRGEDPEDLARAVLANARRLFALAPESKP
ncbi:MAG: TatD family hydrolase [Coriobacteriia bacterium]